MIDFGANTGSSNAGKTLSCYIKELYQIFYQEPKEMNKSYFRTLEKFHIAFLVSGKNKDFNSEGTEALQKVRGRDVYLIYYAIPEERWKGVSDLDIRCYLSNAVEESFKQLEKKAAQSNEIINREELISEFYKGLKRFKSGV